MKRLFLFTLLFAFTSLSANPLSEKVINASLDASVGWTVFNAGDNYKTFWKGKFSNYERSSDGIIYFPIFSVDIASGKQKTNIEWMRINCSEDFVTVLGRYENGMFANENNLKIWQTSDPNSIYYSARLFYCPVDSDNGKKTLTFLTHVDVANKTGDLKTWIPEEVEIVNTNKITVNYYDSKFLQQKTILGYKHKLILDCSSNEVESVSDKKTYNANERNGGQLRFLVDTACRKNDILEYSKFPKKQSKDELVEEAKLKCKTIGIKDKTEKFGICVLEMLK